MLEKEPSDRPSAVELLKDTLIRKRIDVIIEMEIYGEPIANRLKEQLT